MEKSPQRVGFKQLSGPLKFLVVVAWISVGIFGLLFLIGFFAYWGIIAPESSSASDDASVTDFSGTTILANSEGGQSLTIETTSVRPYTQERVEVVGVVHNTGESTRSSVEIVVNCYDSNEVLVGTATTYTNGIVFRNDSASFKAYVDAGSSAIVGSCGSRIMQR